MTLPNNLTKPLSNRLALVTGASGGIGRATALTLAANGSDLALHYNTSSSAAHALAQACRELGAKAEIYQADLSQSPSVKSLVDSVSDSQGQIDILFANAGSTTDLSHVKDIADVSEEVFESTWRVNTLAPFLLAKAVLPGMKARGFGRVIFCSSVAGFTGGVVGPHYASSKSGLHGLVHWISQQYCAHGITSNGIAPALIEGTTMLPGSNAELAKKIPIGRLGTTDEIADTVLWMTKNGYVTNKVIAVDGGLFIQ